MHNGFVNAAVDAPCPTEVGSNWVDFYGRPFGPPEVIVLPCPSHKGVIVTPSPLILIFTGRRIETVNNIAGTKYYKQVYNAQSFSPISESVASSAISCSFDCRC